MSNDTQIRILFLTAEPTDSARLRLGQELRDIREKLQLSRQRENFLLESRESVRPGDITQAIFDVKPHIVHFSGHGTNTGDICLENVSGTVQTVSPNALAELFSLVADQVNCVVLNACYSEAQAKAIAEHIRFVVGMNQAIGDIAAITFAIGFYKALGANLSIEEAYKFGCVEILLQGIPEESTPVLRKKEERYEEELLGWRSSGHKKSWLLQEQKLRTAMKWGAGKNLTISEELAIKNYRLRLIWGIPASLLIMGSGFFVWHNWQKNTGQIVQNVSPPYVSDPELFSQGERTFGIGNGNLSPEDGITAFKNKNYPEAVKQFERVKNIEYSNPEFEIYYNNSRARKKGNYVTLAVALPMDARRENVKEMLRGVAQAQANFNNKGGLRGQGKSISIRLDRRIQRNLM